MWRRLVRYAVMLAMLMVGLLLLLDGWYFSHGSLEEFPTEEQEEKIRVVTGAIAALLVGAELGLWWLLRHVGKERGRRGGN